MHCGGALAGAADPAGRRGGPAPHLLLGHQPRPGLRPKRTRIVALYTCPTPGVTVVTANELGPVLTRTFQPAPGWSADGSKLLWNTAAGRRRPGSTAACASSAATRSPCAPPPATAPDGSASWLCWSRPNPVGAIAVIADNLSGHNSVSTRQWLTEHPRIQRVLIPKAPAGSTCKKPGGVPSAARPWPGRSSLILSRSLMPPPWQPPSSTPEPDHGPGTARLMNLVNAAAVLPTHFEERSIGHLGKWRCCHWTAKSPGP